MLARKVSLAIPSYIGSQRLIWAYAAGRSSEDLKPAGGEAGCLESCW